MPYQDIDGMDPYVCPVYEKVGFVRTDYEYMKDGIPHVRMIFDESSSLLFSPKKL